MAIDAGFNTGVNVGIDASAAEAGARAFNDAVQKMGITAETTVSKIKRTIDGLGDSLLSLKGILAEVGLAMEFKNLVETNIQFARWRVMLDAVAGSTAKGTAEFQWLNEEVDKLGLRLDIAAEQYTAFAAASKDTAIQGEAGRKVFHALAEELTVMHATPQQVLRAMIQMRDMMSIGNITMQHMKYLATSIPDVMVLAAKGLNKSQAEFHKMMKAGLPAEVFFPALAKAMDEQYRAAAEKAANMTQALINRIYNDWMRLQQFINESGFGEAFDNALRHVRDVLESDDIKQAAKNIGEVLAFAINIATDAIVFFGKHIDLAVLAIGSLIGLSTLKWVASLVADIGLAIVSYERLAASAAKAAIAETAAAAGGGGAVRNLPRSLGAAAATPALEEAAVVTAPAAANVVKQTATQYIATANEEEIKGIMSENAERSSLNVTMLGNAENKKKLMLLGEQDAATVKKGMDAERALNDETRVGTGLMQEATKLGGRRGQILAEGAREATKAAEAETVLAAANTAVAESETLVATGIESITVAEAAAGTTAVAVGAATATETGLFATLAGTLMSGVSYILGFVGAMGTMALSLTGIGALILATAGAMYYFRDSVIETAGTSVREGTIIRIIWGDIKDSVHQAFRDMMVDLHDWEDKVKSGFRKVKDDIADVIHELRPMWKPVMSEWEQDFRGFFDVVDDLFNQFDDVILDNFLHRMRSKLDIAVEAIQDYWDDIAHRGGREDDPHFRHHATTTKGLHPNSGIGKGPPMPPPEPKKDPYEDLMEKIADEQKMIEAEDKVYRSHIGTIQDYRMELALLVADHKAMDEFLRLPFEERKAHPEYLDNIKREQERTARLRNSEEQAKSTDAFIKKSKLEIEQQELLAKAALAGGDAAMVAAEYWKEYEEILTKGIKDPELVKQIQAQTDAVIAAKRKLATQEFYTSTAKPTLSGQTDATIIAREAEQKDYELQKQHIADLRDAKEISAKEAAVLQQQIDEAREDRDNRYRMATKDGLNGLIVAEREMNREFQDHAKQMHDLYMKNMQAFQSTLDEFLATGKANWKAFFDGLQKDIIHQITSTTIMPVINKGLGGLFGQADNAGENTAGGGFFGKILGTLFGKNNGPWNEQPPIGSNVPTLGHRVDVRADIVNVRSNERETDDKGRTIIDLLKKPTDEMAKAADENGVVWSDIAKDVGVKFSSAADTINSVMQNIQQGKGGGSILDSVLGLAGTFFGAGIGPGISASDTQLGSLPSIGNDIPSMTGVALPPPDGMAMGGIMTSRGVLNLRRYAGGGIAMANNPQAAIFGEGDMNEAFVPLPDGRSIPVRMTGKGRNAERHYHMENHFHFPNATVDAFRKSRDQIAADMGLVQQAAMARIT